MSQNKTSVWDCNISTLLQSHNPIEWFTKQAKVYIYSVMLTTKVRNAIPAILTRQNALLINYLDRKLLFTRQKSLTTTDHNGLASMVVICCWIITVCMKGFISCNVMDRLKMRGTVKKINISQLWIVRIIHSVDSVPGIPMVYIIIKYTSTICVPSFSNLPIPCCNSYSTL